MSISYNHAAIREMIEAACSAEEILVLAFDLDPALSDELRAETLKSQRSMRLVSYAVRQGKVDDLLAAVRQHNPTRYAEYEAQSEPLAAGRGAGPRQSVSGRDTTDEQASARSRPKPRSAAMIELAQNVLLAVTILAFVALVVHTVIDGGRSSFLGGAAFRAPLVAAVLFLLSLVFAMVVRMRPAYFYRETFALGVLMIGVHGFVLLALATMTSFYPWEIVGSLAALAANREVAQPASNVPSVVLLVVLYIGMFLGLNSLHGRWSGRRSRQQIMRDMVYGTTNVLAEGAGELWRRLRRGPALEEYIDEGELPALKLPEAPIASLAWADQSRELISLVSATYSFRSRVASLDLEELDEASGGADRLRDTPSAKPSDWHDLEGVWIGRNRQTGGAVALIPARDALGEERLAQQIAYAERIAKQRGQQLDEIIIAAREAVPALTLPVSVRMRVVTEYQLLEQTINSDDYRAVIEERVERIQPNTTLMLRDVYVPMRGRLGEHGAPQDIEMTIREWLAEPGRRHIALLGGYGQGKSTVALMLTQKLLAEHAGLPPRIPILIELRGRNLRNLRPYSLLGQWAGRYGMSGRALVRLHEAGRLLLIFEGFDEMAYLADLDMRMSYFRALWEFARYPKAKILISGRPNLFESQGELEQALNLRQAFGTGAYCEPLYLERMSLEEIRAALRAHPEPVREAICALAAEDSRFLDVVSRPSLLQLVAAIWDEPELRIADRALNSADVMRAFVHSTHRRQSEKEERHGEFMVLNEAERAYFMGGVALAMSKTFDLTIDSRRLGELTDRLRVSMPDSVSHEGSALLGRQQHLRLRVHNQRTDEDDPQLVERVKTEVRANALLESEPDAPGILKFGHKSFLEYIIAEEIARTIADRDSARAKVMMRVSGASLTSVSVSNEVMVFLAEIIVSERSENPYHISQIKQLGDEDQLNIARILSLAIIDLKINRLIRKVLFFWVTIQTSLVYAIPWVVITSIVCVLPLYVLYLVFRDIGQNTYAIIVFSLASIVTTILVLSFHANMKNKLDFWVRMCFQIGISDRIIHSEIGTSILPWCRNRPFTFFYNIRRYYKFVDGDFRW